MGATRADGADQDRAGGWRWWAVFATAQHAEAWRVRWQTGGHAARAAADGGHCNAPRACVQQEEQQQASKAGCLSANGML